MKAVDQKDHEYSEKEVHDELLGDIVRPLVLLLFQQKYHIVELFENFRARRRGRRIVRGRKRGAVRHRSTDLVQVRRGVVGSRGPRAAGDELPPLPLVVRRPRDQREQRRAEDCGGRGGCCGVGGVGGGEGLKVLLVLQERGLGVTQRLEGR